MVNSRYKFRAWDKQTKKMLKLIMHVFIEDEWPEGEIESSTVFEWPDVYHVMQYTGLRDKNGKEIFVGDILQRVDALNQRAEISIVKFISAGTVCVLNGKSEIISGFCCLGHGYHGGEITSQIEIIGNVYENPELLK